MHTHTPHICTHVCTHVCTHTQTCTHAHTYMHTRAHVQYMHTHRETHRHTSSMHNIALGQTHHFIHQPYVYISAVLFCMSDHVHSKLDKIKWDLRETEQQARLVSTQCVYMFVLLYALKCVVYICTYVWVCTVCVHMGVCVADFSGWQVRTSTSCQTSTANL